MAWRPQRVHYRAAGVAAVVVLGYLALSLFTNCEICQAANTIVLQGTVSQTCSIGVNQDAAAGNLPLTAGGNQRIQVGTVVQNCNRTQGYTLAISSQNCAAQPTGAKLIDPASNNHLLWTGEFSNPTTGGSQASVTNLLAQACTGQFGRDVSNALITNETSTVFVNYTGNAGLTAGTYQDTITITMNVK
jgi:hypothetical protein